MAPKYESIPHKEPGRLRRALAFAWFETVMWGTSALPDFRVVQRLRGRLVKPCFRSCGKNLMLGRDVTFAYTTHADIGNDVWIAKGAWVMGYGGVRLDDEAMLGPYTVLAAGVHTAENGSYRFAPGRSAPIVIGRGAWTGAHAVITPGVTIGRGAAVAAGTVVTGDVPDDCTVTGVPGRVVKPPASAAR